MFLNPISTAPLAIIQQQTNALQNVFANDLVLLVAANQVKAALPDQELVNVLMRYGKNEKGWPALHYAIYCGDERAAELLLLNGADPNAKAVTGRDRFGNPAGFLSPLDIAITMAWDVKNTDKLNPKIVDLLIKNGADPYNIIYSNYSPIGHAIQGFISADYQLNYEENRNAYLKLKEKHLEILNIFVKYHLDFNRACGKAIGGQPPIGDQTPLWIAIHRNCPELVGFLLANGAKVNNV